MPRLGSSFLLLATACVSVRSNEDLLRQLELEATQRPRPELDAALAATSSPARWAASPSAAELSLLPGSRFPTAIVRVNGVPLRLVIDTGTDGVHLTGQAARRVDLYLPPAGSRDIVSPGRVFKVRTGVAESVELGEATFGPVAVRVAEQEVEKRFLFEVPRGYDGILGCAILSHFVVTFDPSRRRVLLRPHRQETGGGTLFVLLRMHGRRYAMLVDSGALGVFLEPWAAEELNLLDPEDAARHRDDAADGKRVRFTRIRLRNLEVAGRRFEDVSAQVVLTFERYGANIRGVEGVTRPAGLLGPSSLGAGPWTLDFARQRLSFGLPTE